jgi:hypothetical protein
MSSNNPTDAPRPTCTHSIDPTAMPAPARDEDESDTAS